MPMTLDRASIAKTVKTAGAQVKAVAFKRHCDRIMLAHEQRIQAEKQAIFGSKSGQA